MYSAAFLSMQANFQLYGMYTTKVWSLVQEGPCTDTEMEGKTFRINWLPQRIPSTLHKFNDNHYEMDERPYQDYHTVQGKIFRVFPVFLALSMF